MIDLFSDTKTKPTAAMRQVMANAEVGDERANEDPSVNRLIERCAALLGKEAALYLPSGTMCNEIALAVHCKPGDEVLCDATSHVIGFEGGGPAALAGVMLNPIAGIRGIYSADQLRAKLHPDRPYAPRQRLVEVEQTANLGGGAIWPLATLREVAAVAHAAALVTHMDGARLLNACAASGIEAKDYARDFDSVWIDFSKGLGAPGGAVLAGNREFVNEANRWKQRIGGAMRQSGIIAAACEYALDHHVGRLADDHANARRRHRRPAYRFGERADQSRLFRRHCAGGCGSAVYCAGGPQRAHGRDGSANDPRGDASGCDGGRHRNGDSRAA
jgi:threonine aldolase